MKQQYNGKKVNELQHLTVLELDTQQFLIIGGKYPLLMETMPSVDDLTMLLIKPKNCLDGFEQFQLETKGNVLISTQQHFNDNSNLFNNWFERNAALAELEMVGY